jgi:hypothetical protein
MSRASREKGKRGEREFASILRELGFDARRAQQFSGTEGHADVLSSIAGVHWEVKRRSNVASLRFMEQAERDCLSNEVPCVAIREDRGPWVIQLRASDLLRFAAKIIDAQRTSKITSASSTSSSEDGDEETNSVDSTMTKS